MRTTVLILLFCVTTARAQNNFYQIADSVKEYLDRSLFVIQEHALHKDSIDWSQIRENVYQKACGAKDLSDILPLYPAIFEQLGDRYGSLIYNGVPYRWGAEESTCSKATRAAIERYKQVVVRKIEKDIAYILIPSNAGSSLSSLNEEAQALKDSITAINDSSIKGWIIDLRLDTGGNMYPVIAGLGALLGDGKLGEFVGAGNGSEGSWSIKDGNLYVDGLPLSSVKKGDVIIQEPVPLVVLTGSCTAHAGELIAISAISRKNTIVVGERTAGISAVTEYFKISDHLKLHLAVNYAADRNGKIYKEGIFPDLEVKGGDNFPKLKRDKKFRTAVRWLRGVAAQEAEGGTAPL